MTPESVISLFLITSVLGITGLMAAEPAIVIHGDEQRRFDARLPDGGLKPVVGVTNIQILRACSAQPELADQDGWTYAHHQDLAVWKGRLYAAWAMTPKDEDVPPYKVVYSTSTDGFHWSAPADLFPRDIAWSSRFSFYRASNGRMLTFCAGKTGEGPVTEATKKSLLVREITADHRLGPVFTLICPMANLPPSFETSADAGLVAACREAAGNGLLLEQQDLGVFLGDRRMQWHKDSPKLSGWVFGKAFTFYHRKDGAVVGICKQGFVVTSTDEGKTWSKPEIPPTFFAGSGKIWGQRSNDGAFSLVFNPDPKRATRYPLALVQGADGREFNNLRVVHGELPPQRYPGLYKNLGPHYMRGITEWADDGSFADRQAMWIIYSVSKEDIWISRIPLPVQPDETTFVNDDFTKSATGSIVPGWNTYSPKWAPVAVVKEGLELRDGDPYDYARAFRVFPVSAKVRCELRLRAEQTTAELDLELYDATGRRPVRLMLTATGKIQAVDGNSTVELGSYAAGTALALTISADTTAGQCQVQVDGGAIQKFAVAEKGCTTVERLSLRTGSWRGVSEKASDKSAIDPKSDVPSVNPARFLIERVAISKSE